MFGLRKLTALSLLISLGLVLHIVEGYIPTTLIPGARLGLANTVNLIGLVIFGFRGGLQILILRILLSSLLIGSFLTPGFYLSLNGGLAGFAGMCFLFFFYREEFSLIGISIMGAAFHNLGQIVTIYFIIDNPGIIYYLPFLLLLSIPTGIGVGLISIFTIEYLPDYIRSG